MLNSEKIVVKPEFYEWIKAQSEKIGTARSWAIQARKQEGFDGVDWVAFRDQHIAEARRQTLQMFGIPDSSVQ